MPSRRVGMDLENKSGVKPIDKKCRFDNHLESLLVVVLEVQTMVFSLT